MEAKPGAAARGKALLARVRELEATEPDFAIFLAQAIASTDEQDFAVVSPGTYEKGLRRLYARLGARPAGSHLIDIWRPEGEEGAKCQIVSILVDDMPFLVDSVLGAVRAHGGTIRLLSHPILSLDTRATPWKLLAERHEDAHLESFLQVYIDPVTDEASLAALRDELDTVLTEVRRAVRGWLPMLERLRRLVQDYRQHPPGAAPEDVAETLHFLAWLADHNFTFLGMREYRLLTGGEDARLEPLPDSGLGILEDPDYLFLRQGAEYVEMTAQHVVFLKTQAPMMVTKANVRARVHRRGHMDYIGLKLYGEDGGLRGELRVLGLFTSQSLATPPTEVPFLRRKISEVIRRSGHDPKSHAGKALIATLDTYPRDELFQIDTGQLFEFATIISNLTDRPRVRVLPRVDRFDNFVSILLFVPRDRYTSEMRARIGEHLAWRYDGRVSAYYPHFPEGELVRVHFIIGRSGGPTPTVDREELEQEVRRLTRTFGDGLLEAAEDPGAIADYWNAFTPAYQATNSHTDALEDIGVFRTLSNEAQIAVRLRGSDDGDAHLGLKLYHMQTPIPLSDRVPMLEHFGFRVIDERTFEVTPRDGVERYLHDMLITPADGTILDVEIMAPLVERAFLAVWNAEAENDLYNQLTLRAALAWDDVALLRALGRYLRQVGISFSQRYLANTLSAHPAVAAALVRLFHIRHDPASSTSRDAETAEVSGQIIAALENVSSLDEDRIIRRFLNLIEMSLRTNFFQRDEDGARRPALAIKFDPAGIEGMPDPKPYREISVYAPRVEGVHLRGGSIARGGIRWSDRPEDFRTEVLGLVKAQMVKNAVIVPVGAKGGFVPKRMPANPDRDTFMAEGTACYKIFIGALLDITDNLDGDTVVPPENVLRIDGDDPYLVVAADKGTASFSDTANAISIDRGFWLGDAFASGGSAGYDHKKMGITARGGWEAVKRHFREMNHNIQSEPFTCVGVGDMSGDVFGNGMLLSRQTRLIAAFDHRDIFIDPNPEPETSYNERRRLFNLPRSSWQDYDRSVISPGGGVYSRSLKSITLAPEARAALGITAETITPAELMRAILCARVDLLWFGGIGTYVRASTESNAEAGDRANDPIRITGKQVGAKVIGEGANLGITQRGRIEYAMEGGRINTDAIDNSAGVNSSDLEVNIKIALGSLVRAGSMTLAERNAFLVEMTDEVAELCLRNNYLQTLALSLNQRRGMAEFPDHVSFMQALESNGDLNRAIEFLPDNAALAERASAGQPLTRPELSVLLAYAKNTLYQDLLASPVPDDPYLARELFRYFPELLKKRYPETIETHRLRRNVIATVLANAMINRGGPAFVHKMTAATSARSSHVAFGYAAARDSYGLHELNAEIDMLDNRIEGDTQLALYAEVQTLQVNQTLWFLRNISFGDGLSGIVSRYGAGVAEIRGVLDEVLPDFIAQSVKGQEAGFIEGGAPEDLAHRIAELSVLTLASDIILVAERMNTSVTEAARAYFSVLECFRLGRITEQSGAILLSDRYDRMALDRAVTNVLRAQRDLTADVLAATGTSIEERFAAWRETRAAEIDRIVRMVNELTEGELTVSRLSVAAGLLSDLVRA